jgi:hypothetical protein
MHRSGNQQNDYGRSRMRHNRSFASWDELEALTAHRGRVLLKRAEFIQGLTNFYWWAEAVG